MDKNLRLLDKFDRQRNVYELICRLAERVHSIMNGNAVSPENKESNPVQIAMAEFLSDEKKDEQ